MDKCRCFHEHKEFIMETDNQALSSLLVHSWQLGKIGCWVTSFKFKLQHIHGTDNVIAVPLSHMFLEGDLAPSLLVQCTSILLQFLLLFTDKFNHQRHDPDLYPS